MPLLITTTLQWNAVVHRRHHFHAAHLEAAVAENGEGAAVLGEAARADGCRDRVAGRGDAGALEVTPRQPSDSGVPSVTTPLAFRLVVTGEC